MPSGRARRRPDLQHRSPAGSASARWTTARCGGSWTRPRSSGKGINPTLSRQCGPRLAVFFTRIQPFTPQELSALDYYVCTIPRPPNRYRPLAAPLTDPQRRGKAIFERTRTNDGRAIPKERRCITCHFPPYYTDREIHDVGTKMWLDRVAAYDVPHLNNIYDSAPYLHNGIAQTLGRNLDEIQSERPARRHQRHDKRPAQRSRRVPEDTVERNNGRRVDRVQRVPRISTPESGGTRFTRPTLHAACARRRKAITAMKHFMIGLSLRTPAGLRADAWPLPPHHPPPRRTIFPSSIRSGSILR